LSSFTAFERDREGGREQKLSSLFLAYARSLSFSASLPLLASRNDSREREFIRNHSRERARERARERESERERERERERASERERESLTTSTHHTSAPKD
jgi:hypothetical protein